MKGNPWILLALVLLLCAPPMLINVGKPDPVRIMEVLSFMTSQETWLRIHHGESDAWKMPSWNGQPRIQKPPMLVWMNLLAWHDLDPDTASVERLTLRARVLSVGFALLAVAATFWIGRTLGGTRLGMLAALVTGSGMAFIRQARIASYDTHLMGWATLAVASGLWAMKGESRSRIVAGWLLSTLALAAASYTKGPLAFALVLAPLAAALVAFPDRRARNAAGVAVCAVAAVALMTPWFIAAAGTAPDAVRALDREYRFILEAFHNPFFYFSVVAVVFPWSLWLAASLIRVVVDRALRADRNTWFAWLGFVIVFAMFTLSPVKNKRYIVPILPLAGLLVALVWARLEEGDRDGVAARWVLWLRRIHWTLLALCTLALPLFIVFQRQFIRAGWLEAPVVVGLNVAMAAALFVALACTAMAGARAHAQKRWGSAALYTALWMWVASTFGFAGYAVADHQKFPCRSEAECMAALTGRTNLFFISDFKYPQHQARPGDEFLIFYRGIVPRTDLPALKARAGEEHPTFVMTRTDAAHEEEIQKLGFRFMFEVSDGRPPNWKLFGHRREPPAPERPEP